MGIDTAYYVNCLFGVYNNALKMEDGMAAVAIDVADGLMDTYFKAGMKGEDLPDEVTVQIESCEFSMDAAEMVKEGNRNYAQFIKASWEMGRALRNHQTPMRVKYKILGDLSEKLGWISSEAFQADARDPENCDDAEQLRDEDRMLN